MSELTRKGFVYFAESGDLIKVGFSKDPLERLKAINSPTGDEIKIIGVMPNKTREVESRFHIILAPDRVSGEWFKKSEELMSFIRDNAVPAVEMGGYSRSGKIIINFAAPLAIRQELKDIANAENTSSQALLLEAVNMLFESRRKKPMA